jgi:hypothetical protein
MTIEEKQALLHTADAFLESEEGMQIIDSINEQMRVAHSRFEIEYAACHGVTNA